jgi:hypothetical protein
MSNLDFESRRLMPVLTVRLLLALLNSLHNLNAFAAFLLPVSKEYIQETRIFYTGISASV